MQLNWNERMGSNKAIQLRLLNIFIKLQAHNFEQAPAVFIKKINNNGYRYFKNS